MAGLMDGLNKAVSKLQDLGEKALDGAKEALNKTDIDDKLVDAAKGLKDKAQEVLDRTDIDDKLVDAAKGLIDKAKSVVGDAGEAAEKAAPAAPELPKDVMSQLKDEVSAQVEQIRAAASSTNPIHDFIQSKYHPETAAEAPEAPKAEGLQDIVDQAKAAAVKVSDAAERAQSAVGEKLQDIADRAKDAFEQARDAAGVKLQETAAGIEAAGTAQDTVEAAGTAREAAEEILDGPSRETLSEVFETRSGEAPAPSDPRED